jgi:uncharacterized protein with PQ loop repeat
MSVNGILATIGSLTLISMLGFLAAGASLAIILLGLPAQIIKNYRRKSSDGLEPSLIYSVLVAYTLWSLYGWFKPDLFLAISQTPGCVLAFVLLFQMFKYRKR